ncbi:MAG: DUF512 domain-containing protein [Peptococcaceae bacterium]|nr:DUF512 domain-containing protein [Peptococcaceae bacterium]
MKKGLTVSKVLKNSIAEEMDIEPGDIVLEVNRCPVRDILDLQYYTADNEFTMLIEKPNQEIWALEIEKDPHEFLGIEINAVATEGVKRCTNNCVFCFVRQLPSGMREFLYDRDDDYRLSLTQGSYITLTNLQPQDFERIKALHVSPLYISVHAWDRVVRAKLMGNPKAGDLPEQIQMLVDEGITLHTQIVVVPGYNDGKVLEETVKKLAQFYPAVQSIGVVPVGLTRFRADLPSLRTVSSAEAAQILEQGTAWQKELRAKTGKNLVYFSDEFYILSGRDFPPAEEYDDFPQLENGIGMTAKFKEEMKSCLDFLSPAAGGKSKVNEKSKVHRVHIVTGTLAAPFFQQWSEQLAGITGKNIIVHSIANHYFGPEITVAGLLTAQDIAGQLGDLDGDYFLIPKVMLKADEHIFLDGYDIDWLARKVNGQAVVVENNGKTFLEGILGKQIGGGG